MTDKFTEVLLDGTTKARVVSYRDRILLQANAPEGGYLCPCGLTNDIPALQLSQQNAMQDPMFLSYLFEIVGEGIGDLHIPVAPGSLAAARNICLSYGDVVKLRHVFSGQYLTHGIEGTLKFCEAEDLHAAGWFQITPTSRVRNDGQTMHPGDEFMLMVRDTQQWVSATHQVIRFGDYPCVILAGSDSRPLKFNAVLYDPTGVTRDVYKDPAQRRRVVCGQTIALFHREAMGYMRASTSSDAMRAANVVPIQSEVERFTSISSKALLTIENVWNGRGGPVYYDTPVLLRSFSTQSYLCLYDTGEKSSTGHTIYKTAWTPHINTLGTRFYIQTSSKEEVVSQIAASPNARPIVRMFSCIKIASADFSDAWLSVSDDALTDTGKKDVIVRPCDRYSDAFEVTDVSLIVGDVRRVLCMSAPISHYVSVWSSAASIDDIDEDILLNFIAQLQKMLTHVVTPHDGAGDIYDGMQGTLNKFVQQTMCEQRIDQRTLLALCAPFRLISVEDIRSQREENLKYVHLRRITVLCYNLLTCLVKDNAESSRRMGANLSKIRAHLNKDVGATAAMLEILRDNEVVIGQLTEREVISFIEDTANAGMRRKMLSMLSCLMVCNGKSQPRVQRIIREKLLLEYGGMIFNMTADGIEVPQRSDGSFRWVKTNHVGWAVFFDSPDYVAERNYWIATLEMLAALATDSDMGSKYVSNLFPSWNFVLGLISNESLASPIRTACTQVVRRAVVERIRVLPNTVLLYATAMYGQQHRKRWLNSEISQDLTTNIRNIVMEYFTAGIMPDDMLEPPVMLIADNEHMEDNYLALEMVELAYSLLSKHAFGLGDEVRVLVYVMFETARKATEHNAQKLVRKRGAPTPLVLPDPSHSAAVGIPEHVRIVCQVLIRMLDFVTLFIERDTENLVDHCTMFFRSSLDSGNTLHFEGMSQKLKDKGPLQTGGKFLDFVLQMMGSVYPPLVNAATRTLLAAFQRPQSAADLMQRSVMLSGEGELKVLTEITQLLRAMEEGHAFMSDSTVGDATRLITDLSSRMPPSVIEGETRMVQRMIAVSNGHLTVLNIFNTMDPGALSEKSYNSFLHHTMEFLERFVEYCPNNQVVLSGHVAKLLGPHIPFRTVFPTIVGIYRNNHAAIVQTPELLLRTLVDEIAKQTHPVEYIRFMCHLCINQGRTYHRNLSTLLSLFHQRDDTNKIFPFIGASAVPKEASERRHLLNARGVSDAVVRERDYYYATLEFHATCMRGLRSSMMRQEEALATYLDARLPFACRRVSLSFLSAATVTLSADATNRLVQNVAEQLLRDLESIERGLEVGNEVTFVMIDVVPTLLHRACKNRTIHTDTVVLADLVSGYVAALTHVKIPDGTCQPTLDALKKSLEVMLEHNTHERERLVSHIARVSNDSRDREMVASIEKSLDEHFATFSRHFSHFVEMNFRPYTSLHIETRKPEHMFILCETLHSNMLDDLNLGNMMLLLTEFLIIDGDVENSIPSGYDDDFDSIATFLSNLTKIQLDFNSMGITSIMLRYCEYPQPFVRRCAMKLGIHLLTGGNRSVQTIVYQYFQLTAYEAFFQAMRQITTNLGVVLRDYREDFRSLEELAEAIEETTKALKFLQLLCEGHNSDLQSYLREQPDNVVNVNLVRETVMLTRSLFRDLGPELVGLAQQSIDTLVEFCQGPSKENQNVLIEFSAHNIVQTLLELCDNNVHNTPRESLNKLLASSVNMLLAMIEGVENETPLTHVLHRDFFLRLMQVMNDEWITNTINPMLKCTPWFVPSSDGWQDEAEEDDDDDLDLGAAIFSFVASMETYDKTKTLKQLLSHQMSYAYYQHKVAQIEIRRKGNLERVYFTIPEQWHHLQEATKDEIQGEVRRDTPSLKLQDFFARWPDLFEETRIYNINSKRRSMNVFIEYTGYLANMSLSLSVCISVYLMVLMTRAEPDSREYLSKKHYAGFVVMSVFQCFMELWMYSGWLALRGRVLIQKYLKDMEKMAKNPRCPDPDKYAMFVNYRELSAMQRGAVTLLILLLNEEFYVSTVFAAAAPLGILLHPVFFSVQIFRVIQRSASLANVVKAVTLKWQDLLSTIALGVVVVYLFSMVIFYYFSDAYFDLQYNDALGPGFLCQSLAYCFLLNVVYGLRAGGGIGDLLTRPHWNEMPGMPPVAARLLLDFTFWIIMIIIFLNIIFGIILDTFADLRDKKQFCEKDMRTVCFVCGIEAFEFDKLPGGFKLHYHHDHNMWKYFAFYCHIQTKDPTEFTGQEQYVFGKIRTADLSFFSTRESADAEGRYGRRGRGGGAARGAHHGLAREARRHVGEVQVLYPQDEINPSNGARQRR
eukprot:PhM_4_TR7112/c0_g1_i1/m.31399